MINLPNHIAIIPDGNRRWAKKNKISSFLGHKKGYENFNGILKATLDFKVYCLSIWACSRDNIQKRSKKEETHRASQNEEADEEMTVKT